MHIYSDNPVFISKSGHIFMVRVYHFIHFIGEEKEISNTIIGTYKPPSQVYIHIIILSNVIYKSFNVFYSQSMKILII